MKSKKLFAILTLVAFMITLVPVAAFAATTNTALTVPYVSTGAGKTLGSIRITETEATAGGILAGDQFTITLPSNVTFGVTPTENTIITGGSADHPVIEIPANVGVAPNNRIATAMIINATNRSLTLRVGTVTTYATASVNVKFANMSISSGSGPVEAEILDLTNKITSGKVQIATLISAGAKISSLNIPSVTEGDGRTIGVVRVIEDAPGALTTGNTVILTLPDYFRWTADLTTANTFSGNGNYAIDYPGLNTSGRDQLRITVINPNSQATIPGAFDIANIKVRVLPDAPLGEVTLSLSGTNSGVAPSSFVGFKKTEYQTTVTALDTPVRYAGNYNVKIGKVQVKEGAAGTIIAARTIRLDLPNNAVWKAAPQIENVTGTNGSTLLPNGPTWSNNDRTLIYTVNVASDSATTFNFKDGAINIRGNSEPGEVKMTVGGTATVAAEVVVATIAAPLEATTAATTVKIGLQEQPVGDIVIKEVAKEMLKYSVSNVTSAQLILQAPVGVSFAKKPSVAVTAGDLKLSSDNITVDGRELQIPITQSSLVPAEIKVTGILLNVDRTVAEGPLKFQIKGRAINHYGFSSGGADYAADAVGSVTVANVITPAPGDTKAESKVSFTIDSNMYTVGDAQKMMDVAPYIKSGRTYLPIRYVADALGVINDNIMWNDASQTVTIMKGERVIQLKIGSTIMKVQGTDIAMDVAPEVKDGRTMLPVRFVGQALGATIGYDEATQTVTIE